MAEIKVTLLQTKVYADKKKNIEEAAKYMEIAAKGKTDIVTLPEDEKEGYINHSIDLGYVERVRKELPLL